MKLSLISFEGKRIIISGSRFPEKESSNFKISYFFQSTCKIQVSRFFGLKENCTIKINLKMNKSFTIMQIISRWTNKKKHFTLSDEEERYFYRKSKVRG